MSKIGTNRETVTIVGAGLVGSLLSVYLCKRGYKVDLYERRPDMRVETISAGRSINLAISVRGLYALEQVGLKDQVLKFAIPMTGRMIHGKNGETNFQKYGKTELDCIHSISRAELNKTLMTAAEATGSTKIHFNHKFEKESLQHDHTTFATDGAFSVVRDALKENQTIQFTESNLDHGYKELTIPPAKSGGFQMERNALHIWPRGTYMLIALPNMDGSFTCTLFLPHRGPLSFESLKSEADVTTFFNEVFSDALNIMPTLTHDFFKNPTGSLTTIKTFPWNDRGKMLLLGDAAHAIVPFFGQGMNCGFEDCTVLDSMMNEYDDWEPIFERFSSVRKRNADAIADMAVENFIEMRDKVADRQFLLEKQIERKLMDLFPADYISRYSLVSFSRVNYADAYEAGQIQYRILRELSKNIKSADEINVESAKNLVLKELMPFFNETIKPQLSVRAS